MDSRISAPLVANDGSIFYRLAGNDVIERQLSGQELIVPQRDVLHIRLHSERQRPRPLVGESPLLAAYGDIAMFESMKDQQQQFLANRASPSAVLQTDLNLDATQVQSLRDRWNEQAKGLHSGGVPILTHGLKVQPWTQPAVPKDLQLAELLKLASDHIALVFRIPLQLLGLGSAPLGSTEALMSFWLASGLDFCLNHIEESFDKLFGLSGVPDDYTEFDTGVLLRSNQKDRIEGLVRGVQGGIYSPNEARNLEGLDSVGYGDEPRVQQQVVPLSAAATIPIPPAPAPPAPASVAALDATKDYRAAVQREIDAIDALVARAKSPALNGSEKPTIRKTKG
jgi:HK97 family phage portal protein